MKFLKSSLIKKLIIILIILMVFNIAIPKQVKAWDLAGILFKPIASLMISTLVSADVALGLTLTGISSGLDLIGSLVDLITDNKGSAIDNASKALSKIFIGPDTIFSGKVTMLDANIFEDKTINGMVSDVADIIKGASDEGVNLSDIQPGLDMVNTVRKSIASIYHTLRNICGFIMLAGLIFTGIRILLTSNIPTQKSKWLSILQDWFVGMVLLIFSHLIMIGTFYVSDLITDALNLSLIGIGSINASLVVQGLTSWDSAEQIIVITMLTYLLWLTVIFAIAYFKRFLWVCVLTVFAPIVSIMYAFSSQTKQIYSNWLREYISTVFVQPFHLIVYWVLVSIPLNIVNSTGGFDFSIGNSFEVIYALVAIKFIRPAEKYVRQLFQMDKGLASMASYDSGKQTFDAIKDTVKKVATIIASVYTGGAAGMIGKAAGAMTKAGGAMSNLGAAQKGSSALGGAVGKSDGGGLGDMLGGGNNPTGMLNSGDKSMDPNIASPRSSFFDNNYSNGFGTNSFGEQLNPNNNGNYTAIADAEANARAESMFFDNRWEDSEEFRMGKELEESLSKFKNEDTEEENEDTKKDNQYSNLEEYSYGNSKEDKDINASTVNILAGNISITGQAPNTGYGYGERYRNEEENGNVVEQGIRLKDNGLTSDEENDTANNTNDNANNPNSLEDELEFEEGERPREQKRGFINKTVERVKTANSVIEGKTNVADVISDKLNNTRTGNFYKDKILGEKGTDKLERALQMMGRFEDLGGMTELYKGINEIGDTFYAPQAPSSKDWQKTVTIREENRKEKIQKMENKVIHNEANKNYIVAQMEAKGEAQKIRNQYKNRPKEYADKLINDEAKKQLESIAKAYVPLGITDIPLAYELREDEKKYGYTPKEAIIQRNGYEKFNASSRNIQAINSTYDVNVNSVSEAIPNAKQYYYEGGYRDIQNVMDAQWIETKLKTSHDMATKIEKILRDGGKVNYKGDNPEIKKIFNELNGIKDGNKKSRKEEDNDNPIKNYNS